MQKKKEGKTTQDVWSFSEHVSSIIFYTFTRLGRQKIIAHVRLWSRKPSIKRGAFFLSRITLRHLNARINLEPSWINEVASDEILPSHLQPSLTAVRLDCQLLLKLDKQRHSRTFKHAVLSPVNTSDLSVKKPLRPSFQ